LNGNSAGNDATLEAPAVVGKCRSNERGRSVGDFLLHNPWLRLFGLYVGALVVINIIHAMTRQPEPARKTSSVGVEIKSANGPRSEAA
jgi:hypothetical protein